MNHIVASTHRSSRDDPGTPNTLRRDMAPFEFGQSSDIRGVQQQGLNGHIVFLDMREDVRQRDNQLRGLHEDPLHHWWEGGNRTLVLGSPEERLRPHRGTASLRTLHMAVAHSCAELLIGIESTYAVSHSMLTSDSILTRGQRTKAIQKYESNPKHCKLCGTMIPYEGRLNTYCNHSCAAAATNRTRLGGKPRTRKCLDCSAYPEKNHKYCNECRKKHPERANKKTDLKEARTDRVRKRILLAECGIKCQACYNTEWHGCPIPLDLDHIDGDSDNNDRDNLRLICPNCHALTPTYKGRNQGKNSSRQARRGRDTRTVKPFEPPPGFEPS